MSFKNTSPVYIKLCMNMCEKNFYFLGIPVLVICKLSLLQTIISSQLKIVTFPHVFWSGHTQTGNTEI